MNQLDQLLALYKEAQTDAERRLLLQAARICSPGDFPRLEKLILREEVQAIPLDRLATTIATRCGIPLHEAEQELRKMVFEHLLDRADPKEARPPNPAPLAGSEASNNAPAPSPRPETTGVIILDSSGQPQAVPTVTEKVKPDESQDKELSRPTVAKPFGRLQPRGVGG